MKKLFFIFTYLWIVLLLFGQTAGKLPPDSALNNILTQVLLFPQEKIYLQTDKPYYISGEKIFFRIFLLNAFSHRPAEMSRYAYVELINSHDSVEIRQQIRPENRLHYGALALPENLPQGNYRIRAYTRFMENIGENYFYTQPVLILHPDAESKPAAVPAIEEKFEVSFYPEGGNLIAGQSAVAFKALASSGKAIDVCGEIFDSQNSRITDFSTLHEGMGRFVLTAEAGEHYHATVWEKGKDKKETVNLPEVKSGGFALATAWRQDKLWISVNRSPETPPSGLYLVIHTGGLVTYTGEWDFSKEILAIDKKNFPSGVSHLLLLTEDFYPLSERLVFALNDDWLTANVKTQKEVYGTRERVKMDVAIDCEEGNFAVSVTDDRDILPDTASSILTAILLTSELKGSIANPAFYFQKDSRQAELAADLLMMTHGWTRYDIPRAMRGDFQYLTVSGEESQSFSGTVKGGLFSKPYKGSKVTLFATGNGFFDQTETDENGRFTFNGFEFPDSTDCFIQALTKKGKDAVEVYLDSITYPAISPREYCFAGQKEAELKNYVEKAEQKYVQENGKRIIHLPEVTVKAQRKHSSIHYIHADYSLSEREIKTSGDMQILLRRIPGLRITGDILRFRKHGRAAYNSSPPMIVVDGMVMSFGDDTDFIALEVLNSLSIENVDQVDIIRNPAQLYAYGQQGKNGVIEIFTKNGFNYSKLKYNTQSIRPSGYQLPVEFYSPRYDTPELRNSPIPDLRSTVYWKPDAKIDSTGTVSLDFYTADSPSTYSAVIEGVTSDGKLICQIKRAFIKIE
jgi:hypothetical protein